MIVHNKISGGSVGDRLYAELRQYIQVNPADAPIASARQLARDYSLSVGTVRRVLMRLVDEGALYAKDRRGFFVAEKPESTQTLIYLQNWPEPERPYCARLLRGLVDEADRLGYVLEIRPYTDQSNLDRALRPGVQGVIMPWAGDLGQVMRERNPQLRIVSSVSPSRSLQRGLGSVDLDWYTCGHHAGAYLTRSGARNVICVHNTPLLYHGLDDRLARTDGTTLNAIQLRPDFSAQEIARELVTRSPDGVVFADDRYAAQILQLAEAMHPGWTQATTVVSHANAGEHTLPGSVAKLEFDGYDMGVSLLVAMDVMIRCPHLPSSAWAVRPTFVPPETQKGE